jgi:hypothetical protein
MRSLAHNQEARTENSKKMKAFTHRSLTAFMALSLVAIAVIAAHGQTTTRYMGSVTAISGDKITVKTAQGDEHQIQVPSTSEVKRIEPGQTNLNDAVAMPYSEISNGDRVLVWIDPEVTSGIPQALRVVAVKAADLAKKHQREAAEWQTHGVGGLVKSVDPATGTVVITSGTGATAKTIAIHTNKSTILKRYAPTSVNYELAQAAPFSTIQEGDQVMARGAKNPTSGDVAAEEVVSGSFRNISGLIASLDPSTQSFVIKDLASKKQFTVKVPADAQMRQVPERLAQMLAARLNGTPAGNGAAPSQGGNTAGGAPPQGGNPGSTAPQSANAGGPPRGEGGAQGAAQRGGFAQRGGGGSPGNMDPQQMLSRAPAIHFTDLQKGEAVMLVASSGDSEVTAITLIGGVEALLQAPASQNLLANWSMGGGGEGGGDAAQ